MHSPFTCSGWSGRHGGRCFLESFLYLADNNPNKETHTMPEYVDGFVIPVKKSKLAEYKRIAKKACKIWKEYGAVDYRECIGDDLKNDWGAQFPKIAGAKADETVVFSWITYKSRKHRDQVNKKIMSDER